MQPRETSPRGPSLRRDPVIWIAALVFPSLTIPYLFDLVEKDGLVAWSEFVGDVLVYSLLIVAFEWGRRGAAAGSVRIFRHMFVGAFAVLLASDFVFWTEIGWPEEHFSFSEVYVWLVAYILFLVAFAVQPHKDHARRTRIWLRLIRPLATTLLLIGLVTYLALIPMATALELGFQDFDAEFALYFVIDAALVAVAYRTFVRTRQPEWRAIYGWLLAAFTIALLADVLDVTQRMGWVPGAEAGTVLDLLWFLPQVGYVIAGRLLARVATIEPTGADDSADADAELIRAFESWRWMVYALSIPVLHLTLQQLDVLDPGLRGARETFALIYVVSLGSVAFVCERLLRQENLRLKQEMAAAEEQLQFARRLEGIGRLTTGIAHDFNNKLTVINGSSELLLTEMEKGDPHRVLVEDILETGQRAATVVSQLLSFSRRQVRNPRVMEFNRAVAHFVHLLERSLPRNVEIRLSLAPGLPAIEIDPTHLEQIVANCILNSCDAMPVGGVLTVSTRLDRGAGRLELVVADTGVGMTDDVRDRACEPFFTTKPAGEGVGLGLATVYGLAQQSGGAISIESEAGAGTVVCVALPATDKRVNHDLATARTRKPEPATGAPGRVLIAEDEELVRKLMRAVLEGSGYSVVEASNGVEAATILEGTAEDIDILIADVVMPGMNGPELASLGAERFPGLKTLFVTGYGPGHVLRDLAADSNSTLLQKPFTRSQLVAALNSIGIGVVSPV